jgi:hypothetical protein
VFGDTTNLADNQIIHYRCDPADKCRVLIGIALVLIGIMDGHVLWLLIHLKNKRTMIVIPEL